MPFEKGNKLGMGHGRPKLAAEFKARCSAIVDEVVLAKWEAEVRSGGEHWVKCSELLAAYGKGKPAQQVEVSGVDGGPIEHEQVERLTSEQLQRVIEATAEPVTH